MVLGNPLPPSEKALSDPNPNTLTLALYGEEGSLFFSQKLKNIFGRKIMRK